MHFEYIQILQWIVTIPGVLEYHPFTYNQEEPF